MGSVHNIMYKSCLLFLILTPVVLSAAELDGTHQSICDSLCQDEEDGLVSWCVVVCGGVRWCVVVCGGVWWCVVMCGGVWWCVVVCGVVCGGVWWCVVVCGSV